MHADKCVQWKELLPNECYVATQQLTSNHVLDISSACGLNLFIFYLISFGVKKIVTRVIFMCINISQESHFFLYFLFVPRLSQRVLWYETKGVWQSARISYQLTGISLVYIFFAQFTAQQQCAWII